MKAPVRLFAALLAAAPFTPAAAQQAPPAAPRELRIVVNIPAGRLHVYEGGTLTRNYAVSVGTRGHQTPAGQYRVGRVVWNPWWHPPEAEWAKKRKVTPPGAGNPMGRAKIFFRDPDYYIHGTPSEGRLGRPASHGCIRMRNRDVMELARIIHGYDSPLPAAELARLANNSKATREVHLAGRVPVEIVYTVVEVQKGRLRVHPDVYGFAQADMRKRIDAALAASGTDPRKINRQTLSLFLATARSQTRQVPVSLLLVRPKPVDLALSPLPQVHLALRRFAPAEPVLAEAAEEVAALSSEAPEIP